MHARVSFYDLQTQDGDSAVKAHLCVNSASTPATRRHP
jgi:hypothetical protein